MINVILQETGLEIFYAEVAKLGAFFLLLLGVIWILYGVYEGRRRGSFKKRKTEDWDYKITKFLKALTYIGFIIGVLAMISGVGSLMLNEPPSVAYSATIAHRRNLFTCIVLILLGFITFLKPANDLPMAAIIGCLVAIGVTFIVAMMIPQKYKDAIDEIIDYRIVLGIIFFILFAIVGLTIKFYTAGFMALSKAFSWPPIAIIVAVFCFIQGTLLLTAGVSII